jgi:hypothetical protein
VGALVRPLVGVVPALAHLRRVDVRAVPPAVSGFGEGEGTHGTRSGQLQTGQHASPYSISSAQGSHIARWLHV